MSYDQAREYQWQQEAISLRQEVKRLRQIITDAFCDAGTRGGHATSCEGVNWAWKHRYLPATHPARATAPKCDCWVGKAADVLKEQLRLMATPKREGSAMWDPAEAQKENGTQTQRHSDSTEAVVEAPPRLEAPAEQSGAPGSKAGGPRHADYCQGDRDCSCFIRTMRLNDKL